MGSQEKRFDSPFQVEPAVLSWVPAMANFVLAAGSLLFLAYVAMQLRNLTVAVSDKATVNKLGAKIKQMEKRADVGIAQAKEVTELKDLITRYFDTQKAKDEATSKLSGSEKNLDRSLASLKSGVKGRKKKQVEAELKRVKAEGERQIALLKKNSGEAASENRKVYEQLKERLKLQNPTLKSTAGKGR